MIGLFRRRGCEFDLWRSGQGKPHSVLLFDGNRAGGSFEELRTIFDKLAVGADFELLDELRDLPFGTYGHLADRFGVHRFFRGEARTTK